MPKPIANTNDEREYMVTSLGHCDQGYQG